MSHLVKRISAVVLTPFLFYFLHTSLDILTQMLQCVGGRDSSVFFAFSMIKISISFLMTSSELMAMIFKLSIAPLATRL